MERHEGQFQVIGAAQILDAVVLSYDRWSRSRASSYRRSAPSVLRTNAVTKC
jgi:hypothetical protein